ncbi:hypothetical protein Tco_0156852, partial [Tanacetum coccineum]
GCNEGDNEIDSLTKEPLDTLLMGDEVISTNLARENDKFIKSSVDDLVPIPMESEVTSDSNSECDMPVNTPLPTTDVREEDFDINSPLREQVVDFLMENEDIACLPRHLVKQFFSHLVKHLSLTKRMSDEPLGDDSKPRSYDVTFSNPLFDFNDDFALCNSDSMSRSIKTSELILVELTAEIGLDDSISTEIDDGCYDSEGDILFLEHLFIEETFSDPTPVSGGKMRVMKTPSFGFHHMPSPRPAAYSSKEVMYRYYHPHLTPGDGFDPEIKKCHTSGSGKGKMEHQFELTANVPITPHDSPLPGGYTLGSDEGRLKLQELMTMCTKLSKQVLDLEKEKNAQTFESSDDDLDEEDASKQGRGSDKIKPILCNFTLYLWMLKAEEESTMAFELIKFIKSMLEE